MKVYCLFSLESPQRGDSNEYIQYTIPQYKKRKSSKVIPNLHLWDLFQGTQEGVRNSRGKRAISVRAIEVLGKLPVPGRPTITIGQGPTALAVGAGGGCLDIFTFLYFPFSVRYRLKYCLKGPFIPKTTNQPNRATEVLL